MRWIVVALAVAGCTHHRAQAVAADLAAPGAPTDVGGNGTSGGGGADLAPPSDLATSPDLAPPADLAPPPDLSPPPSTDVYVHVYIDNFCKSSTSPAVINAPLHVPLDLTFENDSVDYDADIWSSRGYGAYPLEIGGVWKDPIQHCLDPVPYTEYFDVGIHQGSSACPSYRLYIHCN